MVTFIPSSTVPDFISPQFIADEQLEENPNQSPEPHQDQVLEVKTEESPVSAPIPQEQDPSAANERGLTEEMEAINQPSQLHNYHASGVS